MPESQQTIAIPTISDVADMAGVSIRTVSRVLNRSPKVNALTREQVQQAIASLGFTPSARARAFATGRSQLLGVIQSDENAHVLGVYQRGIVEACAAAGYELVVHHLSVGDPDLAGQLQQFVRRSRVDGLIILPPASESPALPQTLRRLGVPGVALGARPVDGYAAMIVYQERKAAALVAKHLADLGHRQFGMVTGPMWRFSAQEREAGFVEALNDMGLGIEPDDIVDGDYGFASGLAAAERLLARQSPPTAIFAANDMMAAAVLKVAHRHGIDVPGRLSVCGFDDVDLAEVVSPALTTVRRPLDRMGQMATTRLIGLLSGLPADGAINFADFTLVERESTGPAPIMGGMELV